MIMWFNFSIILCYIQLFIAQKYEFDECERSEAGIHVCLKVRDCKSANALIKAGKPLKICSRRGRVSIVCCPPYTSDKIESNATENVTSSRNVTPASETPESNSITIVEQMCKRYEEEQYETYRGFRNTKKPRKVLRCSHMKTSIVGGVQSDPMEFPHMALIGYGTDLENVKWLCGGSLISDKYILSAAHCSNGGPNVGEAKWVRLGELDYSTKMDVTLDVDYEIVERVNHPGYNPPSVYDDIALFKLNKEVIFNAYMRPICLNTKNVITFREGIAAGWGVTGTGYTESEILMKVNISLVTSRTCRQAYGINKFKFSRGIEAVKMLCAGEVAGGKDTCSGDSGGPLMVKFENQPCLYNQIGIVSFGDGFCAKPGQPGVYTRVSYYISWIQKIVWPA